MIIFCKFILYYKFDDKTVPIGLINVIDIKVPFAFLDGIIIKYLYEITNLWIGCEFIKQLYDPIDINW